MALTHPATFDLEAMRAEVQATYEQVAGDPEGIYHFHRGLDYAVDYLLYDRDELEALPIEATQSFAGVGNPHRIAKLPFGATVVDVGSGAGTDLLLAARQVGPAGHAIGVDMTPGMRLLARENAVRANLIDRVQVRDGLAEALPLEDESVDVVLSNGVLNLVADKVKAFTEIRRVLRLGARIQMSDVLLNHDLHEHERANPRLWAA